MNSSDFVIKKNGVLTRYNGPGGDVTIPEGVTVIGGHAFDGCTSLKSVTIPAGVTEIGDDAFNFCMCLKSITIPESVKTIGSGAFAWCTCLQSVTIPESVTHIGHNAFSRTPWLRNWGEFAIVNHILLEYLRGGGDVTIPAGVAKIGGRAFSDCTGLTSVTIPEGVTEIWQSAFEGCTGLQSVTIPASVKKIDESIFENCRPVLIAPHIPVGDFAPKNKPGACAGFAKMYLEQAELDEEIKADYLKYIKGQKKKLYPIAIQHEELLHLMFAEKFITRKDIDPLLEECGKQENATAKAAVLEYADKNLKPVDPMKEFKLKDL